MSQYIPFIANDFIKTKAFNDFTIKKRWFFFYPLPKGGNTQKQQNKAVNWPKQDDKPMSSCSYQSVYKDITICFSWDCTSQDAACLRVLLQMVLSRAEALFLFIHLFYFFQGSLRPIIANVKIMILEQTQDAIFHYEETTPNMMERAEGAFKVWTIFLALTWVSCWNVLNAVLRLKPSQNLWKSLASTNAENVLNSVTSC